MVTDDSSPSQFTLMDMYIAAAKSNAVSPADDAVLVPVVNHSTSPAHLKAMGRLLVDLAERAEYLEGA